MGSAFHVSRSGLPASTRYAQRMPAQLHPMRMSGRGTYHCQSDVVNAGGAIENDSSWFAGRELTRCPWNLCIRCPLRLLPLTTHRLTQVRILSAHGRCSRSRSIELCLRIPTYVLIKNVSDRATARRAVCAGTSRRKSSSGATRAASTQHIRDVLDANLNFVRETMLRTAGSSRRDC